MFGTIIAGAKICGAQVGVAPDAIGGFHCSKKHPVSSAQVCAAEHRVMPPRTPLPPSIRIPFVSTTLELFSVRGPLLMPSVGWPFVLPSVRLEIVALTFNVTV